MSCQNSCLQELAVPIVFNMFSLMFTKFEVFFFGSQRAEALKIAEFPILGRIRNSRVRVKDTTFSSRWVNDFHYFFILSIKMSVNVLKAKGVG